MSAKTMFFIRLEKGKALFIQAATEAEAIEYAGLNVKPADAAEAEALRNLGHGPQTYTIHSFENFFAEFSLTDDGDFALQIESDECAEEIFSHYPALLDPQFTNPADAVNAERGRLTANV